jgi:nucleoside-diphosphate-sugar epimerase
LYKTIQSGIEPYMGSKDQVLTFIYVKDLARVAFDALLSNRTSAEYFVSDGNDYTAGEFAAMVKSILRKRTLSVTFPLPVVKMLSWILEIVYALWGGIPLLNRDKFFILSSMNWRCDHQPLFNDLAFHPEYDLRRGLEETLGYCREQGLL